MTKFADGGTLLWSCNWTKGETFSKIFAMYKDSCRKFTEFNIKTVVFDGYNKSTKDATHKARSSKMFPIVLLDRADFLTNYTNKQNLVNLLVHKLEFHGFKAVLCPSDADTTIVNTSL